MLFNSFEFAIFFPIVLALYFTIPYGWRVPMLLIASCIFYMAFIPVYILILFITIIIDYFAGIYIEQSAGSRKKYLLYVSVIATCLVLFVFKYFNFFNQNFDALAHLIGWNYPVSALNIILPIGLSFHTFQSLSYVIEVYRGHQKAERNFLTYSLYVMFFPQLVAGPIERPQNLLPQFHAKHDFDYARICSGLKRIAWGLFKKVVIADRLALYVNDVYGNPTGFNGLQLTLATFFFAFQIYCDFSGYSDIAIGSARVLGFKLMENFRRPYGAATISEFWRRWHISLSTWLRDYVYYPLGGSRVPKGRWMLNLLITFGISGLWHGSNWTYVVWGLLNGVYLVFGALTQEARGRLYRMVGLEGSIVQRIVGIAITFVLTLVAWVFFRANSLTDAQYILTHFYLGWDVHSIRTEQFLLRQLPVAFAAIAVLLGIQWLQRKISITAVVSKAPIAIRWSAYAVFVFAIILFGVYRKSEFIYFQF